MLLHESHMQDTLLAMLTLARHEHLVFGLIKVSHQMGVKQLTLHVAQPLAERQRQTL